MLLIELVSLLAEADSFAEQQLKKMAEIYNETKNFGKATAVRHPDGLGIQLVADEDDPEGHRFTVTFTPVGSALNRMVDDSDGPEAAALKAKLEKRVKKVTLYEPDTGHGASYLTGPVDLNHTRETVRLLRQEMVNYQEHYGGDNDGEAYPAL